MYQERQRWPEYLSLRQIAEAATSEHNTFRTVKGLDMETVRWYFCHMPFWTITPNKWRKRQLHREFLSFCSQLHFKRTVFLLHCTSNGNVFGMNIWEVLSKPNAHGQAWDKYLRNYCLFWSFSCLSSRKASPFLSSEASACIKYVYMFWCQPPKTKKAR